MVGVGVGGRVSGEESWGNSRANRHHTRGIDRRQLAGDECFRNSARRRGRRCRGSCARKHTGIRQPGSRDLIMQDGSDFLYDMDPSMTRALALKQMVVPCAHVLNRKHKVRQTAVNFRQAAPSVPASPRPCPLPPLPARPIPLPPPLTQREDDEDEDFDDDPLLLS